MRATLILGGGPGGTGPLIWAAQSGVLPDWLAAGVTVIDAGGALGGTLGRYIINSDSLGGVYLECLCTPTARTLFGPLLDAPVYHELEAQRSGFPPLELVDRYQHCLGSLLADALARHPGGEFIPEVRVRALRYRLDGALSAELVTAGGRSVEMAARTVILALGGRRRANDQSVEVAHGVHLSEIARDKLVPSDQLVTAAGRRYAATVIARAPSPRVVILGGSHSAYSAAWVLTETMPEISFGPGDITILAHRQPPIFYESLAAAAADGYPASAADVCPRTQRVHRLGGVRGDGREMWRRITRRPGCVPEPRVVLRPLSDPALSATALRRLLDEAALIVPAFGYRARTVPVFDARGARLRLNAERDGAAVDSDARLLRDDGTPLPNLFGIGLGSGYRPTAAMGGEPSFTGQANSLWLYQHHIGAVIHHGVQQGLAEASRARSAGRFGRPSSRRVAAASDRS
ncbi:MAG TPA: hypothetical protein VMB81_16020 [Candidatus Sulfotelmatobacter sp.]|nr:hypothetical protein [Candidatus Sulfotelmatobacter sp.]